MRNGFPGRVKSATYTNDSTAGQSAGKPPFLTASKVRGVGPRDCTLNQEYLQSGRAACPRSFFLPKG